MNQSVDKGEDVEVGTTIQVTVSSGPDDFEMPRVVGNPSATARDMLTSRGLVVDPDSSYEYSDSPEGNVIRQSPEAGALVKKGDTVKLTISKGTQQVQVPNLLKQTQEKAAELLAASQLAGDATTEYDDTIPEGSVISQSPEAGSSVNVNSTVNYVVSLGKKEVFYKVADGTTIKIPTNSEYVVSADISLLDANGEEIDRWDGVSISSFPYAISGSNITTSSGTVSIVWVLEDGEERTEELEIKFVQQ